MRSPDARSASRTSPTSSRPTSRIGVSAEWTKSSSDRRGSGHRSDAVRRRDPARRSSMSDCSPSDRSARVSCRAASRLRVSTIPIRHHPWHCSRLKVAPLDRAPDAQEPEAEAGGSADECSQLFLVLRQVAAGTRSVPRGWRRWTMLAMEQPRWRSAATYR